MCKVDLFALIKIKIKYGHICFLFQKACCLFIVFTRGVKLRTAKKMFVFACL